MITDQDYEQALRDLCITAPWSRIHERALFVAGMREVDDAYRRLNEIIASGPIGANLRKHEQAVREAAQALGILLDLHCPVVSP
ncbi:MAG: hypothetical protein KBB21_38325 [Nannocystaceae bacterium]|nr:hypothetical protein [Deltaproteobacteria bacterium]MBP7292549.1 hypothetical protein [Nannocystaceae bacterium]